MNFNPHKIGVICQGPTSINSAATRHTTTLSNRPAMPDSSASPSTAPYLGILTWLQPPREPLSLYLSPSFPKDVKATCYKTLVRPQLQYGSSIWDPPTKSRINRLEVVQCHCSKILSQRLQTHEQCNSYDGRLKLPPPTTKVIMLYRIVNQLQRYSGICTDLCGNPTRGHANKFLGPYCSIDAYKYSFYLSSIRLWNSLPAELTTAPSLDVFKARIGTAIT